MPQVTISLNGCDDCTIINVWLTPEQLQGFEEVSNMSYEIGGGCMPTLEIERVGTE